MKTYNPSPLSTRKLRRNSASGPILRPALNRRAPRQRRGTVLILVITVACIFMIALMYILTHVYDTQRAQAQRIEQDRAFQVAECALAQAVSWLQVQPTPPTDATTLDGFASQIQLPTEYSGNYTANVKIFNDSVGGAEYWTIVATAKYQANPGAGGGGGMQTSTLSTIQEGGQGSSGALTHDFNRRVQITLYPENFARFEQFVDYSKIWGQGALFVYGLNQVFLGPVHSNSGVGMFPNLWFVDTFSTSASGKPVTRDYTRWSDYIAGVYGKADAYNYINRLLKYTGDFIYSPKFYNGCDQLTQAITLPDMRVDSRAATLRARAGLHLPDDFPGYDSSKGANFVIELSDPSPAEGDGVVKVRQFLGYDQSTIPPTPLYNPPNDASGNAVWETRSLDSINHGIVVDGNVVSLRGVLDGTLTIGAFRATDGDGKGNIAVTGSIEYQSRKAMMTADPPFKYTDDSSLYTLGPDNDGDGKPDTKEINATKVDELKSELDNLNDILGLVAERDVIVKEFDIEGNRIANGISDPLYLDAVVMSTGKSTLSNTHDGSYTVENYSQRPKGKVYRLGGSIQQEAGTWARWSASGSHIAGLIGPTLFDFRATRPSGAPPYFPTTGNYLYLEGSWRENFVNSPDSYDDSSEPVWRPTL